MSDKSGMVVRGTRESNCRSSRCGDAQYRDTRDARGLEQQGQPRRPGIAVMCSPYESENLNTRDIAEIPYKRSGTGSRSDSGDPHRRGGTGSRSDSGGPHRRGGTGSRSDSGGPHRRGGTGSRIDSDSPYRRGSTRRSSRINIRKQRRRNRILVRICTIGAQLALCAGIIAAIGNIGKLPAEADGKTPWADMASATEGMYLWSDAAAGAGVSSAGSDMDSDGYPELLQELLELNEETADFVKSYPDRSVYQSQTIDLTEDLRGSEVPLLMQWDRRWGYDAYGDEMIGLSGCGPVCLDMAYLYFTGDTGMTPREMAVFAYDNGYFASGGTSWSLWTQGAAKLGLVGEELSLDESRMRQVLDQGGLIVCSMRPGDFTTTGHFILIRGYDENGFYVNDPNRRSNSSRQWDYDTLYPQIKNLWSLRKE